MKRPTTIATALVIDGSNHVTTTVIANQSAMIHPSDANQQPLLFYRSPIMVSQLFQQQDVNEQSIEPSSTTRTNFDDRMRRFDRMNTSISLPINVMQTESGDEMILTAAKLTSRFVPSSSAITSTSFC
jgi:hypothetical protein